MRDSSDEARSLKDVRVLVTRPLAQADRLVQLIEAAGGTALRFPMVEILAPPDDNAGLLDIVARLHTFDYAIFISPTAVGKAMNLISSRGAWPPALVAACVGRGSAKELQRFGIGAPLVPTGKFDSEALAALPQFQQVAGKRIVIFRGDGGRELLGDSLQARGATIEYAECYRRAKPRMDMAPLLRAWARGEVDVVTLTSAASARNLFDLLGKLGQQWLIKTPTVVVSERMADICLELGFKTRPLIAAEASDEAIVATLKAWRTTQKPL